jgi:hypothetical protein
MGREQVPNVDVSWDHEPLEIPLIRPSGTFSPSGGEGWDEGVRFMGREELRNLKQTSRLRVSANPTLTPPLALLTSAAMNLTGQSFHGVSWGYYFSPTHLRGGLF